MRRREFIALLGGAAVTGPLAARAQQPTMPVIGWLDAARAVTTPMVPFRQGLGEAGFVEGRNVTFEIALAEGRYERLPAMAAELVKRRVALIAATAPVAALAAKAATTSIPIVFSLGSDPVKDGLVRQP
jgi:putative ABC transport system substrate-binding protein